MSNFEEALVIRDEMIRLGQALKLANIADDGIMAREMIAAGVVHVNGEQELRRGRQLHAGDVIELPEENIAVVIETS